MPTLNIGGWNNPAPTSYSMRGFDATANAGTAADYYVDWSVPEAGNSFQTITAAVAQVVSDGVAKTIAIKDGTYRESVTLPQEFAGVITGYGTDKPLITAQEIATGWTVCDSGDESRVGSNYASIYKKTVSSYSVGLTDCLNMYEGDTPVPICQVRLTTGDLDHIGYDADFVRADSFTLNGSNQITAITDSDVLTGLSSAGLVGQAWVMLYYDPNATDKVNITAYSGSTIDVDGLLYVQGKTASPDADDLRYNLTNYLPSLIQGTYGVWDNGDNTVTIYIWPNNAANLENGTLSYAARTGVFYVEGVSENITFKNLILEGAAGNSKTSGYCIHFRNSIGNYSNNMVVENCKVGKTSNISAEGYGPIICEGVNNLRIERITMDRGFGGFGLFVANSTVARVLNNVFTNISAAGTRFAGITDGICAFNDYRYNGKGAHSNAWNAYAYTDKFLFFGNFIRDCYGYGTTQGASRVFVGFNVHTGDISSEGSRIFVDQAKDNYSPPTDASTNYVFHNDFLPDPSNLAAGVLTVGAQWKSGWTGTDADHPFNQRWVVEGNLTHGGGCTENYATPPAGRDYWRNRPGYDADWIEKKTAGNFYTALAFYQTGAYGWALQPSEDVEEDLDVVFTDVSTGDYTRPPGSPALTHTSVSLSDTIAAAKALWPDFDFTKDRDGNPINVSAPKVGALHGSDVNAQIVAMFA